MEKISKQLYLDLPPKLAFQRFTQELNQWWPPEYTWSQEKLVEISIDPKPDGLCTEIGPHGFRCDWGRVTALAEGESLTMLWQISPKREPIPDPNQASEIHVSFAAGKPNGTELTFEHLHFERHGEEGDHYREMMDSPYGWDYILERFQRHCGSAEK